MTAQLDRMKVLKYLLHFFLAIGLLMSSCPSNAQNGDPKFLHLSVDDGLSHASANCFLEDSRGYMWIGTNDGLNRYDGGKFNVYKAELPNQKIEVLEEDRFGNIWIGTSSGLAIYNTALELFSEISFFKTKGILDIKKDSGGQIWVITEGSKYLYNIHPNQYLNAQIRIDSLSTWDVEPQVITFRGDEIWLSSINQGLLVIDQKGMLSPVNDLVNQISNPNISALLVDEGGGVWVGDTKGHLTSIDPVLWQVSTYDLNVGDKTTGAIREMVQYSTDELWVISITGEWGKYHIRTNEFTLHEVKNQLDYGLTKGPLKSIYKDRDGNVWIGSCNFGINIYSERINEFAYYRHSIDDSLNFNSLSIKYLDISTDNRLWVGTDRGLSVWNGHSFEHPDIKGIAVELEFLRDVRADTQSGIWLATEQGLIWYNHGKTTVFKKTQFPMMTSDQITLLTIDNKGNIWFVIADDEVYMLDRTSFAMSRFFINDNGERLVNDKITTIEVLDETSIVLGTNKGVVLIDSRKRSQRRFILGKSPNENIVGSMLKHKPNEFWVGTYGGLVKLNIVSGKVSMPFTETNGVLSHSIYGILEDESKNLWLSSDDGIFNLNPKTGEIVSYDQGDGLQSNTFKKGACVKDDHGYLYFGGINGFDKFHPDSLGRYDKGPAIVITDFKINYKDTRIDTLEGPIFRPIQHEDTIVLKYGQSVISIEYAALNFIASHQNKFAYYLDGLETEWNYVGNRRFVTYSNLEYGKTYVFKLKAANNYDVWSENPQSIVIVIESPWWGSVWFKVFLLFLLEVLVIGLYLIYRNIRLLKRKQLQMEVDESTAIVRTQQNILLKQSDNLEKALARAEHSNKELEAFSYSISHDLRAPLRAIDGFSKILLEDYVHEFTIESKRLLNVIIRNSGKMALLIDDVLTFSRIGRKVSEFKSMDLQELVQELLEEHNIDESILKVSFLPYVKGDRALLKQVFSNLIGNAIKFSAKQDHPIVEIGYLTKPDKYEFFISDNGVGFDMAYYDKIFGVFNRLHTEDEFKGTGVGLAIVQKIISVHHGKIWAESNEGEGATFYFSLPC